MKRRAIRKKTIDVTGCVAVAVHSPNIFKMAYFNHLFLFLIIISLFLKPLTNAQSLSSFIGPAITAGSTGLSKIPGQSFSDQVANTFSGFTGNLNRLSSPLTSGNTLPDFTPNAPQVIGPGFPPPGASAGTPGVGGPGVPGFMAGGNNLNAGVAPNFAQSGMGGGMGSLTTQFRADGGGPSLTMPGMGGGAGGDTGGSYSGGTSAYGGGGGGVDAYGANAGYGGYPGRGGFSGYWEPGVRPVPLALQGWGLFIPRPPVEITTPTTVATTTAKTTAPVGPSVYMNSVYGGTYYDYATTPATTTTTTRPTTTSTTTTTTTTTRPTTTTSTTYGYNNYNNMGGYGISYYTVTIPPPPTTTTTRPTTTTTGYTYNNYASYGSPSSSYSGYGGTANKNLPLALTDQKILIMGSNIPVENNRFKSSSGNVAVDVAVEPPSSCVPTKTPSAKGICVDDGMLQVVCPNMIVGESDDCKGSQGPWCCFVDSTP